MKKPKSLPALAFLLALVLRLFLIIKRPIFPDEIQALFLSQANISDIWLGTYSEMIAPLYFIIIKLSHLPVTVLGLRFISLGFGLLACFLIKYLAEMVLGKKVSQIAFILSLFLPALIWASIFARYYSLLICLSSISMIAFIRYLKTKDGKFLILLVITLVMGTYTHHYFFLLVPAFAVYLLKTGQWRSALVGWLISLVATIILLIPGWYYLLILRKPEFWRSINDLIKIPAALTANVVSFETLLYNYPPANWYTFVFFASLTVILVVLLIKSWQNWHNDFRFLFGGILILPPIIALIVSYLYRPVFGINSLSIFLPAVIIFLANGLSQSKTWMGLFGLFLTISLVLFVQSSLRPATFNDPYIFVNNNLSGQDLVIHSDIYTFIQAKYYLGDRINFGAVATTYLPATEKALGYKVIPLKDIVAHQGRVWYFEPIYFNMKPAKDLLNFLKKNFTLIEKKDFPDSLINIYIFIH